jgi:hypothetical protein
MSVSATECNGERNSHGEMTYVNGDKYNGKWINDERHGHGEMTYVNGDKYNGKWINDERHGQW